MGQVSSSFSDTSLDTMPLTHAPLVYVMDPNYINTVVYISSSFLIISPVLFSKGNIFLAFIVSSMIVHY